MKLMEKDGLNRNLRTKIKELEFENKKLNKHLKRASFSYTYELKTLNQLINIKNRSTEKIMLTVETNIEEIKESIDEFRIGIAEIVSAINQISSAIIELSKSSEKEREASRLLVGMIEKIQMNNDSESDELEKINGHISKFKAKSSAIVKLLVDLEDISDILHLLGINGAIEAARNGKHGYGFAVVAGEIRKLSENVKTSAITQKKAITESLSLISLAVEEESNVKKLTENTVLSIKSAKAQIGKFLTEADQIASASEQLSATVIEFRASIEEISATINTIGNHIEKFYTKFRNEMELNRVISEISTTFNQIAGQTNSLEESATQQMHFLRNIFSNTKDASDSSIALSRIFITMPFHSLPEEYRKGLKKNTDHENESMFLCLLGTAGEDPSWNEVGKSAAHKYILLPKRKKDLTVMPMLDVVFSSLGIDYNDIINPEAEKERPAVEGYFLAEDAVSSPFIPAKDFLSEHNIISQLSIGGVLPSGKIFTCFLFFKHRISEEVAENLNILATILQKTYKNYDEDGKYWKN